MTQSIPAIREPVPCGHADDLTRGREPCQQGWYAFVVEQLASLPGCFIADVGAGTCKGVDALSEAKHFAVGIEPDVRLQGSHPRLLITPPEALPDKSFDMVTCMDVIEHVVDDLDFLKTLRRIARYRVFVSTPNFTRSQARNAHHARELTIPQFIRHYRPDELWVGSPDGWHHRTLLLRSFAQHGLPAGECFRVECGKRRERVIAYDRVSDDLGFTDTTVDGMEWAHMMGVWYGSR